MSAHLSPRSLLTGVRAYFGEPIFVDQVNNATVAVGRDASLQCQVENVGEYKVSEQLRVSRAGK